jgi:hypothetical protein
MGVDFRGIRVRLQSRLERLRLQATLALLNLLKPIVVKLGSQSQREQFAAEWAIHDQETAENSERTYRKAVFANVGLALSAWAGMEELLVAIASLLLRTVEFPKVGTIMYSIVSFSVWLSIIDELFALEPLYGALKPKWNKINGRLRGLKDTRDRLAHHTIYSGGTVPGGDTSLRPARFDVRQKSQKYQPLDYDQTSKFIDSIGDTTNALRELLDAMTALLTLETSQRKSSESNPDPPPG